jgi:hypothetical protein
VSYDHIEGITGREPVGAVLTIGRKGASGAPIETDRFFIVSPYEGPDGVRPLLPEFHRFNSAPAAARQVILGNLVHTLQADAWTHYLRAHRLPKPNPNPSSGAPACQGDGTRATRFDGLADDGAERWREIACPHRLCEFRLGADPKPCRPFGRLYFRPSWAHYRDGDFRNLPTPLMKWSTTSWFTVANMVGLFEHVATQATALRLPEASIYGLPFSLRLSRKTRPSQKRAFPVVTATPEIDLIDFFLMQRRQLADAGALPALAAGNTDPAELGPRALAADFHTITPGIPARTEHLALSDLHDGDDEG